MNKEMDDESKDAVSMRRFQECNENLILKGIYKELAKCHKSLYDEYVNQGFNEIQALDLVKTYIHTTLGRN